MTRLSAGQIAQVAREGGFPESAIPMAVAVALAESSGDPSAHNGNRLTGDDSYGLWQINMLGSMGPARRKQFGISSNSELFNPVTNARAAARLSNGGSNWGPWSTYPAKAALYLPQARSAARSATGTATQANWWDDLKKGWDTGPWGDHPDPPDWLEPVIPDTLTGDSGIWAIGTLLTGFSTAITNPDNWRNWAYVAIGGALVIAGLVVVTKPYAQQAANALPTGRLVNAAKSAAGKG